MRLDWHTVKELDKQYMREQLRRVGIKSRWAIGVDEISVGRGHDYRIVVSDLVRGRPIWFGGPGSPSKSLGSKPWPTDGPKRETKLYFHVQFHAGELAALSPPKAEYRLGSFLSDRCQLNSEYRVKAPDLYAAFKNWSKANGEPEISGKAFGQAMTERGFHKDAGKRWYIGLALTFKNEENEAEYGPSQ